MLLLFNVLGYKKKLLFPHKSTFPTCPMMTREIQQVRFPHNNHMEKYGFHTYIVNYDIRAIESTANNIND